MTRSAHARAVRFCSVTALAGIAALVAVLLQGPGLAVQSELPTVLVFSVGVFVGETFPLQVPRGRGEEHLTFSSTFSFGLLILAGLWPAVLVQSIASALPDLHARRPAWRILFNVGQYVLALVAAGAVLHLDPALLVAGRGGFTSTQLPFVLVAAGTFWCVNIALVGVALALWQDATLASYFRRDLMFSLVTGMALLGLSPVLVRWSQFCLAAFPLFGLPLYAVYHGGRHAVSSEHQASHDSLTGLPNRLFFRRMVEEESKRSRRGECYAVLLLDLDRFKEINDTLGHAWGDRLLVEVASRIREVVRSEDVLARLGGDEFALLLTCLTDRYLPARTAKRITEALAKPIEMENLTVQADLSIGIAASDSGHRDVEEMLRRADVAMYHAKRHHLGIHVFDEADDHFHPDQLGLAAELRSGIQAGQLVLHYQPKLDLGTDQVRSFEALVRWQHPRLGLLQPGAFIELAEHTGVMGNLTRKVIETALLDCARWRARGWPLTIAVNVSMRSLRERRFATEVAELIDHVGAQPDWLMLEITESTIMADPGTVMIVLRDLEDMGVLLSIDDFGTGYSSLSHLRQLPVTELKIDRSFVKGLGNAQPDSDAAIIRSTVELAHNLGLTVVAEGVENRATVDRLRGMGCDQIQGYYLSRPLPADEISVWLAERAVSPQPQLRVV
jgi:diguanylate cyclase (GGDEF)-like protein